MPGTSRSYGEGLDRLAERVGAVDGALRVDELSVERLVVRAGAAPSHVTSGVTPGPIAVAR